MTSSVTHAVTDRCSVCGESFEPRRPDARYCSSACRQRAFRRRGSVTAGDTDRVTAPDRTSVTAVGVTAVAAPSVTVRVTAAERLVAILADFDAFCTAHDPANLAGLPALDFGTAEQHAVAVTAWLMRYTAYLPSTRLGAA